ncbi:RNA binding protein EIF1AD [Fasciolopsis buskii]|uniref:Probable RNA-binding protein EIF1AD n=1 Tax=Fasciolopsis buskii TaxID=27845 RepID=A0A8E0VFG2_9TREM|nr:RNA binding protein EIF1AD [Fasciolopsis buski]
MYPSSLPRRKKVEQELFESLPSVESGEFICRSKSRGNYLFTALDESNVEVVVSIPERFRNAFYFAPGDFVLCRPVDSKRVRGEIRALLGGKQIRHLANMGSWPETFPLERLPKRNLAERTYIPSDMLPPSSSESAGESEEDLPNVNPS